MYIFKKISYTPLIIILDKKMALDRNKSKEVYVVIQRCPCRMTEGNNTNFCQC